jgi:thiol-disulfide isomerase/thioredoxin
MSDFPSQASSTTNIPESLNFPSLRSGEALNFMFSTNMNKNFSSPQRMQFSSSGNELSVGDSTVLAEDLSKPKMNFSVKTPETLNLDVSSFQEKLQGNNGIIIFKFGASWCKPCKVTEPHFNNFYNYLTSNENIHKKIECINIDVDDSFELYATMKRYRMVKGLPTFLAYYKNNNTYITDDSSIGSDINQLNSFFTRCLNKLNDM